MQMKPPKILRSVNWDMQNLCLVTLQEDVIRAVYRYPHKPVTMLKADKKNEVGTVLTGTQRHC